MKPTPTKVALLMSAAGLGLSLPGFALAQTDVDGRPDLGSTFGVPFRHEQETKAGPAAGALLERDPVNGGADLESQTSPVAATTEARQSVDAGWSHLVFEAYSASLALPPNVPRAVDPTRANAALVLAAQAHRARGVPAFGRPEGLVPRQAAVAAEEEPVDGTERTHVGDAIAMVLMVDPPLRSRATAEGASDVPAQLASSPRELPASKAQRHRQPTDKRAADSPEIGSRYGADSPPAERTGRELADLAADSPAPLAYLTLTVANGGASASAAPVNGGQVAASEAVDRSVATDSSIGIADAGVPDQANGLPRSSIELVLNTLAEFSGARVDVPALSPETAEMQAGVEARDGAAALPQAVSAVKTAVESSISPLDFVDSNANVIERVGAADGIVVATHTDKVLMSLAALRSGEEPASGRFGAQTKEKVVASHTEKVLQTLAALRQNKAKKQIRTRVLSPAAVLQEGLEPPGTETDSLVALQAAPVVSSAPVGSAEASSSNAQQSPPGSSSAGSIRDRDGSAPAYTPVVPAPAGPHPMGYELVALSADKLDEVRGGFVTQDGLRISFGIERAVYLNGSLVTTTSLNIADLSKISGGQAQVTGAGAGSLALVQSGSGNTFMPTTVSPSALGTIVQNTLDNQKIQTITRIDAVVNSSGIMRGINLQSSMRSAIIDSLRR